MTDSNKSYFSFTASCASGVEKLLAEEIRSFGASEIEWARGLVTWRGHVESAYLACLWSRFASRVFLTIARFSAPDEDALYNGILKVDWDSHMSVQSTFAVDCVLNDSNITHSRFAALRVKDALVDQFRDRYDRRPSVNLDRPDIRVRIYLYQNEATLSLDLSGESLHMRGYRVDGGGVAPLKENLAAAIVALSGWNRLSGNDRETMFLDPMCGSGTLLIEAALIYGDVAPGLYRKHFGFNGWKQHDASLWSKLVDDAVAREGVAMDGKWPVMIGYDCDPRAVALARRNIENAGLEGRIVVKQGQLANLRRPAARGLLVTNPPYGERLSEKDEAEQLHRALGRILRREFVGWRLGVFTSNPEFGDRMEINWSGNHRLYNGPINCRLFNGVVNTEPEQDFQWHLCTENGPAEGIDFGNRLRKNARKLFKWSRREGIHCFRLYDRDLQEYNVSVDIYEKWILVQEYVAPASVSEDAARERFQLILAHVRHLFGARRDRVFIKSRRKQKGKSQYQKQASRKKMHTVREGSCFFLVNFTDYLDTGLFLDHRNMRLRLAKEAAGKRFLNLFAYTGTASIHAAAGGAASTTTVDLSANYLNWAKLNFSLNGFGGPAHESVRADCMQWLLEDRGEYDLIFVDPPTFSNTKKDDRVFDVQRDHKRLIELAVSRLADDGLLIFSTNFRQFRMDSSLESAYSLRNISRESVPFDFSANSKIHQCWEVRKK